jgi:hypothetical protein
VVHRGHHDRVVARRCQVVEDLGLQRLALGGALRGLGLAVLADRLERRLADPDDVGVELPAAGLRDCLDGGLPVAGVRVAVEGDLRRR